MIETEEWPGSSICYTRAQKILAYWGLEAYRRIKASPKKHVSKYGFNCHKIGKDSYYVQTEQMKELQDALNAADEAAIKTIILKNLDIVFDKKPNSVK